MATWTPKTLGEREQEMRRKGVLPDAAPSVAEMQSFVDNLQTIDTPELRRKYREGADMKIDFNWLTAAYRAIQPSLLDVPRQFQGETLEVAHDQARLARLLDRVRSLMADGHWRTLGEIQQAVGGSEASVSARLRDLRKSDQGAHEVQRRRRGDPARGLFEYRVL